MKIIEFQFKFNWNLFPGIQLKMNIIGLDNGLAPNRRQAIIWTNADPVDWRIYAALGDAELTHNKAVSGCKTLNDSAVFH